MAQYDGTRNAARKAVRGTRFFRLADAAGPNLRAAAAQRGMAEHRLIQDWPTIAGKEIAALCRPLRISQKGRGEALGATLTVAAAGPLVPEVTHLTDQIAERANRAYGYRAITRVRVQADTAPPATMLAEPDTPWLHDAPDLPPSDAVAAITDPELRAALARLEANIRRHKPRPGTDD